jgi:flagellar protein FlaG
MIIQNTPQMNQVVQPSNPAPARPDTRPVVVPASQAVQAQPSAQELKNAVAAINQAMQQSNRNLEFSVDSDTNTTVVKMVDTSTGELIRQFPSETTLAISRGIEQFQQGLLLRQKA